jgi:hypothetical protein
MAGAVAVAVAGAVAVAETEGVAGAVAVVVARVGTVAGVWRAGAVTPKVVLIGGRLTMTLARRLGLAW